MKSKPNGRARRLRGRHLALLLFASTLWADVSPAQSTTRVLVFKKRTFSADPAVPLFLSISSSAIAAGGFTAVADYPGRTLYEGPAAAPAALIAALRAEGYDARVAGELDTLRFHDFLIDPETGAATPAVPAGDYRPAGATGLYLLALDGYPVNSWFDDLAARDIRFVEALPPGGLLVRGDRSVVENLKTSTSFTRGVFPVLPGMKKVFFDAPAPDASPFRRVAIGAVEEAAADSLKNYLDSVSDRPVVVTTRSNNRVAYEAALTDLDIENLTRFEQVYSVSPTGDAKPSSERQGVLALQPTFKDGRMTLPAATPNYIDILAKAGVVIPGAANAFDNTVFGIIDTGFDNGNISLAGIHPDFKFTPSTGGEVATVVSGVSEFEGGFQDDRTFHGTLTASIIGGYAPFGQRHDGGSVSGHRHTLGLASTARMRVDKYFNCSEAGSLSAATDRFLGTSVSVLNLSFNSTSSCGYTLDSAVVDDRTRDRNWLFTISAGNKNDAACQTVRGPATAKNAIAVGATENFTLDWPGDQSVTGGTCAWSRYPPAFGASHDARNIPSFSAEKEPSSMVKPDLVAPGLRVTGPVSRWPSPCNGDIFGVFCRQHLLGQAPAVNYGFSAGTSFAAPAVAGAAGVVRKWYRNVKGTDPRPAMTKAILINGARDIGGSGAVVRDQNFGFAGSIGHIPDKYQGWGMLNLTRLLGHGADYYFFDEGVELINNTVDNRWQKTLYVRDGTKDLRFTLVWSEPSGSTGSTYRAVNDLDLSVDRTAGCPCWYGNQFNTSTGFSAPTPPAPYSPDVGINNVEQVIIPAYTYATGTALRVNVVFQGGHPFLNTRQKFAFFVDNASDSSAPPKTYFYTVTPCRVVDTRNPEGQWGSPALEANSERTFQVPTNCGIPATARSVSFNATMTLASAAGSLRFYPSGRTPPNTSNLNYSAGQTRANNAIIGLGPTRGITVRTDQGSGAVHFILDVNGYFQ